MQLSFKDSFINDDINILRWFNFFLYVIRDECDELSINGFLSEFLLNWILYDLAISDRS